MLTINNIYQLFQTLIRNFHMSFRHVLRGLGILAISIGLLTPAVADEMTMGEAINKAGRQRMLTQRIVKSYCQIGQKIRFVQSTKQLKAAVSLFEKQLSWLKAFTKNDEVKSGLNKVDQLWVPVKKIALGKVSRESAEKLRTEAEKLLQAAHNVVLLLEKESSTSKGHLVNISGRQRMLSQRMGNLYLLASWGFKNPIYTQDFETATQEFSAALDELTAAPKNTSEIAKGLKRVSGYWDMFKLSNKLKEGEYVPDLVTRMLDKILKNMNDITGMYAVLPASK
jgi:nitrate/nitrite-specific signal transduction histidine kinase